MTVGITELPPEGMQLGGVALAGDADRGTKTTEGLSLLFTTAGITVQGPQPQIERLLVWSGLDTATCREKIALSDGRSAAVMELTSGGQSIRFLLPTETVTPGQAAYLDQALPAWLARYKGAPAAGAAPAPPAPAPQAPAPQAPANHPVAAAGAAGMAAGAAGATTAGIGDPSPATPSEAPGMPAPATAFTPPPPPPPAPAPFGGATTAPTRRCGGPTGPDHVGTSVTSGTSGTGGFTAAGCPVAPAPDFLAPASQAPPPPPPPAPGQPGGAPTAPAGPSAGWEGLTTPAPAGEPALGWDGQPLGQVPAGDVLPPPPKKSRSWRKGRQEAPAVADAPAGAGQFGPPPGPPTQPVPLVQGVLPPPPDQFRAPGGSPPPPVWKPPVDPVTGEAVWDSAYGTDGAPAAPVEETSKKSKRSINWRRGAKAGAVGAAAGVGAAAVVEGSGAPGALAPGLPPRPRRRAGAARRRSLAVRCPGRTRPGRWSDRRRRCLDHHPGRRPGRAVRCRTPGTRGWSLPPRGRFGRQGRQVG